MMGYLLNTTNHFLVAVFLLVLFVALKTVYHLLFSPLAGFPGPRLAASTKLYEAYHMIIKDDSSL